MPYACNIHVRVLVCTRRTTHKCVWACAWGLTLVVLILFPEEHIQPELSGKVLHSSPSRQGSISHHHFPITMDAVGRQVDRGGLVHHPACTLHSSSRHKGVDGCWRRSLMNNDRHEEHLPLECRRAGRKLVHVQKPPTQMFFSVSITCTLYTKSTHTPQEFHPAEPRAWSLASEQL